MGRAGPSTRPARGRRLVMQRLPLRRMIAAVLLLSVVSAAAVVFALAVGASQPGPELTPVLGEPPCAAPCWYAIHPGETDLIETAAVLDNNPAVEALVINVRSASWWSSANSGDLRQPAAPVRRPHPVREQRARQPGAGRGADDDAQPRRPLFGPGRASITDVSSAPGKHASRRHYEAEYDGLSVFASLTCPISPNDFWNAEAGITYGEVDLSLGGVRVSSAGISGWPMRRFASLCAP